VFGRAEDVLPGLCAFDLVTMAQSFHWMDRDLVLARLAEAIRPGGGLVIVDEGRRRPQESWELVAGQVVERFLGRTTRHPLKHPEKAHEPSLRRSHRFSDFTVREFASQLTRDLASIRGAVYSGISSARPLFGDRLAEFETALTAALLELNPTGVFHEQLETAVYVTRS
jgi:SAM-dependent methyltransferase